MGTVLLVTVLTIGLCLSGVWTGVALLIAGAVGMWLSFGSLAPLQIGSSIWSAVNSGTLVAIPLFVLMGELLAGSRAATALFAFLTRYGRGMPATAPLGTVMVGALVSCVSGSLAAVTAITTRTAYKELRADGLRTQESLGLVASVGALGIMLPPSLTLIIYGSLTETAISSLFRAAIVPGLIQVVLFAALAVWMWKRHRVAPVADASRRKDFSAAAAWQFPVAILIVLGSFLAGWVTPVEAAALGAGTAILMNVLNGEASWRHLRLATRRTVVSTAMIMLILLGAQMISATLAFQGFGRQASLFVQGLDLPPVAILMLIALLYIGLGLLFDGLSMMVLTLPFVFPAIVALGFDPLWLGVILVLCVQIAELSPPVGVNLFVAQYLTREPIELVWRGALPYMGMLAFVLLLLILFPGIATVLR